MKNPQRVADTLERIFTGILNEQMRGIPILNHAIDVQAVDFREYQGRILGALITPWLMSVVLLPREDEDWSEFELGKKQPQSFPGGTYKFMINEIDEIGICQTHSLYSPMREFGNHAQALGVAQDFLDRLMQEKSPGEEELVDEELLGRVMRGEVVPETDFPDFSMLDDSVGDSITAVTPEPEANTGGLSRRDLLRGKLQREA